MQRLAAFLAASALLAGPALSQTPYEPPPADEQPGDLEGDLENGIQGVLENLLNEVQPHLDQLGRDLSDTMNSFTPVLGELKGMMDDVGNYQTPERLPNGDILIRRRADAPPPPPIGDTLRDLLAPNQKPMPPGAVPLPETPKAMPKASPAPEAEPLPDTDQSPGIEL